MRKFYVLVFFLTFQVLLWSQVYNYNTPPAYASTEKEYRVALIMGNSDYNMGPLANPVNDARSIARALKANGFEVMLYENVPDKDMMKIAIREFGKKLRMNRGVGLFYYAGHGVQVDGFNYLIPVQAQMASEAEVEYEAVDVGFVLAQMEGAENRVNIIVLDACRNNPFAKTMRSADRGLASINAPMGSMIAYATSPGSTASDGSGDNGLYTEALLKQLERENLKIEEVFKNVRAEVIQKSGGQQTPWESSSLIGDFYFKKSANTNTAEQAITQAAPVQQAPVQQKQTSSKVTWKANNDGYWIYLNNREISNETTYKVDGQNLIVTHKPTGRNYLLKSYFNSLDGYEREAEIIEIAANNYALPAQKTVVQAETELQTTAKWKASKGVYWIFIDGKEVSNETSNSWAGKDLKVVHKPTSKTFLLKDFNKCLDGKVRIATEMK